MYPQTTKAVREARRTVVSFATTCGFGGQCLEDIEIAVGEALANAVEHGCGDGGNGSFEVEVRCDARAITIEVADSGHGFDHAQVNRPVRPASESVRGFGTSIMRQLMDEIEYTSRGTRLRLVKRVPATAANEATAMG